MLPAGPLMAVEADTLAATRGVKFHGVGAEVAGAAALAPDWAEGGTGRTPAEASATVPRFCAAETMVGARGGAAIPWPGSKG